MRKMTPGLRPETFDHLQLGAGVLIRGFPWRDCGDAAALRDRLSARLRTGKGAAGAVRSGEFRCVPKLRFPEGDARRPYAGGCVLDGWDVRLNVEMREALPENLNRALTLKAEEELVWIGDTGRGLCVIALENALCVSGAVLQFRERAEGALPAVFIGLDGAMTPEEGPPCEIAFFDEPKEGTPGD